MGKFLCILTIGLSFSITVMGQSAAGWLPEITLTYKPSTDWKVTLQGESMQQVWRQAPRADWDADYQYIRTDITGFAAYRLSPLYTVAAGYLFRITDGGIIHRSIQQLSGVQRLPNFRLGHRLRTDQTFVQDADTEFRLRYRLSAEFPLGGQRVDNQEWYIIGSYENLGKLEGGTVDWEKRLVGGLGYNFNPQHKIEFGFDYRLDRFIRGLPRHRTWGTISYFVNLNP